MTGSVRTTVTLLFGFAALVAGLFAWRMTLPVQVQAAELDRLGLFMFPQAREIPAFSLSATTGELAGNAQLKGRWTVLFFGFTHCPDVCPTTLADVSAVWRNLAPADQQRVQFWMASVDPQRDQMPHLKTYVEHFDPRMLAVRGSVVEMAEFARLFNAVFARVPGPEEHYQVDHSAHLALISPTGHFVGILKPPVQRDSVRRTLDLLLKHYPFEVVGS